MSARRRFDPKARGAAFALGMLLAVAPCAFAQGQPPGLNLFWDQCYSSGGALSKSFACDLNTGPTLAVVASLVLPVELPRFAAVEITVDVFVAGGALPPWWQTASGQCRANAITVSFDPVVLGDLGCPNIWMDTPNLSVFAIQPGVWAPNTLRLRAGAAVPPGSEIALLADGSELTVARIAISRVKSTGPGACEGCSSMACLFFRQARLEQPAGVGDHWLWNPSATPMVWLNTPAWGSQCEIPTLNRTWGAIKTLYR